MIELRHHLCNNKGHFKREYLEKGKSTKGDNSSRDASVVVDEIGYDRAEALSISSSSSNGT